MENDNKPTPIQMMNRWIAIGLLVVGGIYGVYQLDPFAPSDDCEVIVESHENHNYGQLYRFPCAEFHRSWLKPGYYGSISLENGELMKFETVGTSD